MEDVGCPPLLIEAQHGSLALSTLARHVGALVEFGCQATDHVITGAQVLACGTDGQWNDTLPICSTLESLIPVVFTTPIPDVTTTANNTLPAEVEIKPEVELIVLILWCIGGLLLILLLVLIGCILRTHQKTRRNSTRTREAQRTNFPRHRGGVNPSFTNYDEIWTWIPVVTDASANCSSQVNPSARENSSTQAQQQAALVSRLRLPSYNEAVRTTSGNHRNNDNVTSRPGGERQATHAARAPVASTSQSGITSQANSQNTRTVTGEVIEQQPYDTIPADIRTLPRTHERTYEDLPTLPVATSTLRPETATSNAASNTRTSVAVTSSSGRALADARALVHQTASYQRNETQTTNLQPPLHGRRIEGSSTNTRGIQIDTYQAAVVQESRDIRGSRSTREVVSASRQSRDRSHRNGAEHVQGMEFRRSSASAFMYYGERTRPRSSNYPAENCRLQSWQMLPSNGPTERYRQQPTSAPIVRLNYF